MSFAKVMIMGNLGKDAELKTSERAQKKFAVFSIAVNEKKLAENGEPKEITNWFQVILWGKQAENLAQYLKKGREVIIEGSLSVEHYKDDHNESQVFLQVRASDVQFTNGSKEKGEKKEETASVPAPAQTSTTIEETSVGKAKSKTARKPEAAA